MATPATRTATGIRVADPHGWQVALIARGDGGVFDLCLLGPQHTVMIPVTLATMRTLAFWFLRYLAANGLRIWRLRRKLRAELVTS